MADTPSPKDPIAFLTRKLGPAPIWVYAVVIVGAYVWYTRYGPGKSSSGGQSVPIGQQTDPAGNTGVIDPLTGYVQGSPEDTASLQAQNEIAAGSGSTTGSSSTGGYATEDQWATAAENYLIGLGIDPTVATQAIGNYLGSLPNTTAQQADVNTAIEGIGPPPQLPGPASSNPPPVTGGGGGGTGGKGKPKGIKLKQAHAITNAQGETLFDHPGNGGVYWKASDGSYVQTDTGKGVGKLYTGADGWAYLQKHKGK